MDVTRVERARQTAFDWPQKARLAQGKFASQNLEAGGVEPPSEKPCHPKTTCLSHSVRGPATRAVRSFAARAQNWQDARVASPMSLAAALRTETRRPAYCVTPHPNRVDNDGGSALPTFG
jgi:hypothetical protein